MRTLSIGDIGAQCGADTASALQNVARRGSHSSVLHYILPSKRRESCNQPPTTRHSLSTINTPMIIDQNSIILMLPCVECDGCKRTRVITSPPHWTTSVQQLGGFAKNSPQEPPRQLQPRATRVVLRSRSQARSPSPIRSEGVQESGARFSDEESTYRCCNIKNCCCGTLGFKATCPLRAQWRYILVTKILTGASKRRILLGLSSDYHSRVFQDLC